MATYLKIDLVPPQHVALLNQIKAHFRKERKDNVFSMNTNLAGTMAWVKTVRIPQMAKGTSHMILDVVIGSYSSEFERMAAEVNSVEWIGAEDASGNEV